MCSKKVISVDDTGYIFRKPGGYYGINLRCFEVHTTDSPGIGSGHFFLSGQTVTRSSMLKIRSEMKISRDKKVRNPVFPIQALCSTKIHPSDFILGTSERDT